MPIIPGSITPISDSQVRSLKEAWEQVLRRECTPADRQDAFFSSMHQISPSARLPNGARKVRNRRLAGVRYTWDLPLGEGLYLRVTPQGGRHWQYRYRYDGKQRRLALGTYPWLSLERAMMCRRLARDFLAAGTDPALRRNELRYGPYVAGLAAQASRGNLQKSRDDRMRQLD